MTDSLNVKYKGIDKAKVIEIQESNLPKLGIPIVDIQELDRDGLLPNLNNALGIIAAKEAKNKDIYVLCEMAKMYLDSFVGDDLNNEIKSKAEIIAKILMCGNSVELKKNKDGLLILEIKRKVIK